MFIYHPIGPEEIIHNLQGHDLDKLRKLILDGGEEYGICELDDFF